jgi:cholesterol transport system auxiliary component
MRRILTQVHALRSGAVAIVAAALAACGGLRSDAAPDQIYVLNAVRPAAAANVVPGVLVVARPVVQPGLDTDRIALTRGGNELDYYATSRWSGSLPQVLGAFARQSIAGGFATVSSGGPGVGAVDYELLLTVRQFEAAYGNGGGAPEVRISLECLLVATVPRRVLGSCDTEGRAPAGENRMGAIVQAFERGAQRTFGEVRSKAMALAGAARTSTAPTPP